MKPKLKADTRICTFTEKDKTELLDILRRVRALEDVAKFLNGFRAWQRKQSAKPKKRAKK